MGRSLLAQPRTVSSFLRSAMPLPPPVITRTSGARLSSCAEGLHNTSPPNERGHSQERSASLPAKGGGDDPPGTYWRRSGDVVKEEMLRCFQVVERMGPGIVYFGSSRTPEDHPHFGLARNLSRDAARLLGGVTTWSGLGGGMMDAVSQGALEAGTPAAGFKIYREGGKWVGLDGSWRHPYLPEEAYVTCEFFSARKHGLAEAASRTSEADKTAVVVLPGGTGTLDEVFEIIVLMQLGKLGREHRVPVLLMNYDDFYSKLLDFLDHTVEYGVLGRDELSSFFTVCNNNQEALDRLAEFYPS